MARRGSKSEPWTFSKTGSFGHFSTDVTVPIQFLMTTFSIDELSQLSFARDIQTDVNFELLVQRDIDEDRARSEISQYISPEKSEKRSDEIVFLPPLLAAVVGSEEGNQICDYYPTENCVPMDDNGETAFVRQWGDLFQITHFEENSTDSNSYELELNIQNEGVVKKYIDSSYSKMKFRLAIEENPGARLVVIDGQHRLFALKHLKKEHYNKVKHILLPVCILFSPKSTLEYKSDDFPTVTKVLRDTFVHVNSTVEKVSGHFVILLSDQTLGSLICRSFCDNVLEDPELGEKGLSLIEWNTKNHKESKTITKSYTITSIGVLYDILEEHFKQRKTNTGIPLLKKFINITSIKDKIDFGSNEDGTKKPMPADFPWRDFHYQHKDKLKKLVEESISPCLKKIFFESACYRHVFDVYDSATNKLSDERKLRGADGPIAGILYDYLIKFNPVKTDVNQVKLRQEDFDAEIKMGLQEKYPLIIRNNIFQKGLISAWLTFLASVKKWNFKPEDITSAFIELFDLVLDKKVGTFVYDMSHTYLHDSIYDGPKIKPTKKTRQQIERLILGFLGNKKHCDKIVTSLVACEPAFEEGNDLQSMLIKLGDEQAAMFNTQLLELRRNAFEKKYKSSTSLDSGVREELAKLEKELVDAKRQKVDELPDRYEKLIDKQIKDEFLNSINQLDSLFGFKTSRAEASHMFEDEEED